MYLKSELLQRTLTGAIAGSAFFTTMLYFPPWYFLMLLSIVTIFILAVEWPLLCRTNKKLWILTPLYPLFPLFFLGWLSYSTTYSFLLPSIFFITFMHDTGAYLVGKMWGRHLLAPSISPKKTWEGVFGGLIWVFLSLGILGYFFDTTLFSRGTSIACLLISLFATMGDLWESWLKRRAGIKNSSNFLPGHGGFLDRLDSSFFVSFLIFFLCKCFN